MNLRNIAFQLYSKMGIDRFFLNTEPRVLFYHGVADTLSNPHIETESIFSPDFERQLLYIKKHFNAISLDQFYDRFVNHSWNGKEILLTFDDGYKNILHTALPILEKYDLPFALFLTTDNISNYKLFPTTINRIINLASSHSRKLIDPLRDVDKISRDLKTKSIEEVERICDTMLSKIDIAELQSLREKYGSINPMSWEEAAIVAQSPLCTIGSHCVTHICCHTKQSESEIKRQFGMSKDEIESRLGIECKYLSYPNGNYTPQVKHIAKECGYKMAFSTNYCSIVKPQSDIYAVGRIYVPYDYNRFKYAISQYPGK